VPSIRGLACARVLALGLAIMGMAAANPPNAAALDKHLCGINGTVVNIQEACPGISPRHHWKRVTGYRIDWGIDMCIVVRNRNNNYLFSRCSWRATSIYIPPKDMDQGKALTRVYNKNNNVTIGKERRWLYASTD
jgi:hypothetical protein